ncbi:DUF736 family protein, partial [Arenibaculum sp.]|uniref:DUF736 family protein n=1 Tax=Arenibaculum sp. TaxID=2865862 RepID=UPI002E0F0299|nr:DUF736 family protein [Arenibaculum sp.]
MAKVGTASFQISPRGAKIGRGHLRTIKLHLEFQLFPTAERTSDEAPAFDVVTMDGVHLGAAWERESRGG